MNFNISRIGCLFVALVLLVMSSVEVRAQQGLPGERVETARTLLEQLVKSRQMHSKEGADFKARMQTLDDQAALLRAQIQSLKEKTEARIGTNAEVRKTLEDLKTKEAGIDAGNQALVDKVAGFEVRTKKIFKGLPDPVKDKVRPLAQAIPDDPNDTDLDPSRRFQAVVGILNAANKFNSEISSAIETRPLGTRADGRAVEGIVTTIYLGVGQAFFISQDEKTAGRGVSSLEGWKWSVSDSTEEIARAIRILQNKEPAGFVRLPVTIN